MIRGIVAKIIYEGTLVVVLFTSAGRWNWPIGWAAIGIHVVLSTLALVLAEPELIEERSHVRPGIERWDAILASVSFLFFYPLSLLVAGLDAGRYGWSPALPIVIQYVALVVFALGNGLALWAVLSNRYFSTFIRLQKDRGHEVVNEGPYQYIRHPGYAGTILAVVVLPIALGSIWALIPAMIGAGGFVLRTYLEDRILSKGLYGYQEYMDQVPFRLIPGIW